MRTLSRIGVIAAILLLCAACGTATTGTTGNEGEQASGTIGGGQAGESEAVSETPEPEPESEPTRDYPDIFHLGDKLVYPNQFEITMVSTEFATKVAPSKPGSFHTYYEVKEPDKIYVHSVFHVKNLGGSALSADSILDVLVTYDGKYEYRGFFTIEEAGGSDFTYTNITSINPLTTGVLHHLAEVPLEVKESGKSLEFAVTAGGSTVTSAGAAGEGETLVVADEATLSDNTDWQQYTPLQAGTATTVGEYAEFAVLDAELTTKVVPPKANGFYSYYEVKDPANIYAHVAFSFKNLMPIGKDASEAMSPRLIYDNKYQYRGFAAVEERGGADFTYASITRIDPLATERLHYMFELPAEAKDSGLPVVFVLELEGEKYYYELER